MKKNSRIAVVIFILLIALFIILKKNINNENNNFDRDKVVIVAKEEKVKSLDPLIQKGRISDLVFKQIYENLVRYNENNEIVGELSESWKVINETEIIFYLKKEIFFSDGTELKASDVKFSLERQAIRGELLYIINEVEILDDYTVKIKVNYAVDTLLDTLANIEAAIISKDSFQKSQKIVGTGPYMVKSFSLKEENNVVLEINKYYLKEGCYKIKGIVFKNLPSEKERKKRIEDLSIDIVYNLSSGLKPQILKNENLEWKEIQSLDTVMLVFNNSNEIFKNINLKKAIAHSIDKFSIISGVAKGRATYANSPVHENIKGHSNELIDYQHDNKIAKEYMKKFNNGDKIEITLIVIKREALADVAKIIKDQLKQINIEVKIVELSFYDYWKAVKEEKNAMFLMTWFSKIPHIDYTLYNLFYSKSLNNYPSYSNKEIDEAFEKNLKGDIPYQRIQEIVNEELPVIPIAYYDRNVVFSKRIKNYKVDRLGNTIFFDLTLEPLNEKKD